MQVVENVLKSNHAKIHSDGTSLHQKKIVGHQISTSLGETFYLGYIPVATKNASTLLEITSNIIQKLSETYYMMSNVDLKKVTFDLLSKITSVMTDRAAGMKCLDRIFADFIRTELGRDVHVHFLHCNGHFLLGMSSACEKVISKVEKELESERQQKFGRDQNAKYDGFNKGSESCVSRVIRTACDIVGPRGDQKSGCRVQWTTFIANSVIPYFKEIDLTAFLRKLLL